MGDGDQTRLLPNYTRLYTYLLRFYSYNIIIIILIIYYSIENIDITLYKMRLVDDRC